MEGREGEQVDSVEMGLDWETSWDEIEIETVFAMVTLVSSEEVGWDREVILVTVVFSEEVGWDREVILFLLSNQGKARLFKATFKPGESDSSSC